MKINRALLANGVAKEFEEEIDFSSTSFDQTHIRQISSCKVKAVATDYETILRIEVTINAVVIGVCSYSLEDVELKLKINDDWEVRATNLPRDEFSVRDLKKLYQIR